ncbi:hypothetical protein Emag_000803 [Eimeria magna]
MLPLIALLVGISTSGFPVLGVAAAVDSTDGSSAFLERHFPNNVGDPSAFAVEEVWGPRRLDASDYGELEEATGDAADDGFRAGVETRRLAVSHSPTEENQVDVELREQQVSEEKKENEEEVVELEHRRVLKTMPELPPSKGVKTLLVAIAVMVLGVLMVDTTRARIERSLISDNRKTEEIFFTIGMGISWVGLALSVASLVEFISSGVRRYKWAKTAQRAIMNYQGEMQGVE